MVTMGFQISNCCSCQKFAIKKAFSTVMILSFRTDRSGQTVQTQIRLFLEEQSDQSRHCLLFHLHIFLIDNVIKNCIIQG